MGMSRPEGKNRSGTRRKHFNPAIGKQCNLQSDQTDGHPDDPMSPCTCPAPTTQGNLPQAPCQREHGCQYDKEEPSRVMAATKKKRHDKEDTEESRIDYPQSVLGKQWLAMNTGSPMIGVLLMLVAPA